MYVMVAVVDVELTKPESAYFDSEDDYRTSCRNVSHCQQQQSDQTQPTLEPS